MITFKEYFLQEKKQLNKILIVVDIQPEYTKQHGDFSVYKFCNWLNSQQYKKIVFLYNGEDMGMTDKTSLQMWYLEHELDENIIHNSIFIDKGYAFFRYLMDKGHDDADVVSVVKFMMDININDSREITEEQWDIFVKNTNKQKIRDTLENSGDMIHIPDVMDKLAEYSGQLDLVGGAKNECLREVEIILTVQNKKYNLLRDWIYETTAGE